jgi:trehalose 6-phosphate phosphatase
LLPQARGSRDNREVLAAALGHMGHKTNPMGRRPKGQTPEPRGKGRPPRPHLFDCWPQVVQAVDAAKHVALFLDFDGTLVPLRRRPGDVKPLDASLRKTLRGLAGHKRLTVGVISGRPLIELRKLVPVPRVRLLGLHGWEGRAVSALDEERRLLRQAKRWLDHRLAATPKIWVENKGLGLAVHYRGASPSAVRRARPLIGEVLGILGPQIHMMEGHKIWELLPRQIDGKGAAVRDLLSEMPARTLPIFVGDDVTDESAFQALPRGLTIRVGERARTEARFLLRNPVEVEVFLLRLGKEIL